MVQALSEAQDIEEVRSLFASLNVTEYSPFDLFVFSPSQSTLQLSWDGNIFSEKTTSEPFASSSGFDPIAVIASRHRQYLDRGKLSLADFHRSHSPSRSAYSVCTHRSDAKTQSYTRIRVDDARCDFWYSDGSPCEAQLSEPISIPRLGSFPTQLAQ